MLKTLRKIAKATLRPISILCAAGLLLAYLSTFVSPADVWFLAFFGLFYQVLLIANLVLGILWLCFRKKFAFIHFGVILIGVSYIGAFVQLGKPSLSSDERVLKLITYNVHIFNSHNEQNTYREIADFLNRENADIICLQEFYIHEGKMGSDAAFAKLLNGRYYRHVFYNIVKKKTKFGLAIFSRYPIIGKGEFSFARSTNAAMFVDIDVAGKPLRVYNNHLQSTKFNISKSLSRFAKEDERIDELVDASSIIKSAFIKRADQVDTISQSISRSPYAVIVCGDFNDTPVSYAYRKMKSGLEDSFIAAGRGVPSTYRGFIPSFRIDYIFYDKSLKAVDYQVAAEEEHSDHYPVITKLLL